MADIVWRGTREELFRRLALLPSALSGGVADARESAATVARTLGVEALACLRDDFLGKARGGGGSDGVPWKPLSPAYVAYKRRHPGLNQRRKYAASQGRAARPLLTAAQDQLWRSVYASRLKAKDDPRTAAMRAWGVVKAAGGKTIIGTYGSAKVEIGRDTGRLLASYSPGGADSLFEPEPGSVRLGSNVAYARHFHAVRPIVPKALPAPWRTRLLDALDASLPNFLRSYLAG